MQTELFEKTGGVKIDLNYMGFMVLPVVPLQTPGASSACGGCAGSTSCSV